MKDLTDPTNVDSVPAMLTPGEFVLNKEASSVYGPQVEAMNEHGLQIREAKNMGGPISMNPVKLDAVGYNTGGLVTYLKDAEGWKPNAYQDSGGVWTIGYGRTTNTDGSAVKKGAKTTREAENTWLDKRAGEELTAINDYADKYGYDWNDGQKNALASFRYNGGQGMLDMLTADGTRDNATILKKFPEYNKVTDPKTGEKVKVDGLVNRRNSELELWNSVTPTETTAVEPAGASPETQQAAQAVPPEETQVPPMDAAPPEINADAAVAEALGTGQEEADSLSLGGFPGGGDTLSALATGFGGGGNFAVPSLGAKAPPPEYIPSVTERSNPMRNNDIAMNNMGGPIEYLGRGGGAGQVKTWDSDTGKYIWVGKDDPRHTQAAVDNKAAIQRLQDKKQSPMNFAAAAQAPTQGPVPAPMAAPPNPGQIAPIDNAAISQSTGGALQGRIGMMNPPAPGQVPELDTEPPKPLPTLNSDEDLIQGSSESQIETGGQDQSERTMRQLFDQKFGAGQYDAVNAGNVEPTEEMLDFEDETHNRLEQLDLNRKKQSVVAEDTDGQALLQQQEQSLVAAMSDAPVAPGYEGGAVPSPVGRTTPGNAPVQAPVPGGMGGGYAPPPEMPQGIPQIETNTPRPPAPEFAQEVGGLATPGAVAEEPFNPVFAEQSQSAAQARGVPYAEPVDRPEAPSIDTASAEQPQTHEEKTTSVADKMEEANPGGDMGNLAGKSGEEVATAAEAMVEANPGMLDSAKSAISRGLGDLFDSKELVRMGVMYLGALATGASPGQALSFAGSQYIQRIDSKASIEAKYSHDLIKSGKYTPASIQAFTESDGDASLLMPTDPATAVKELGNTKEFYGKGGQRIAGRQVEVNGNKVWLDGQNKPINLNNIHEDPSRVAGTKEYSARVATESKANATIFKEIQDRQGKFKSEDGEDRYTTDLTPGKVGSDASKWAIENGVSPEDMGGLIDNAYAQARLSSKDGKRVKNITPYLNAQYIQANVGQPDLFLNRDGDPADAKWVSELMNKAQNLARTLPQFKGMPAAELSSKLLQAGRAEWNSLDQDVRDNFTSSAGSGESGFMKWFNDDLIKSKLAQQ